MVRDGANSVAILLTLVVVVVAVVVDIKSRSCCSTERKGRPLKIEQISCRFTINIPNFRLAFEISNSSSQKYLEIYTIFTGRRTSMEEK